MKEKFEKYINKLFKGVPDTEEVKEAKEELTSDMMEKSKELKKKTKNEAEIYQITIDSFGDLKELVKMYKKENNKLSKKIELPKYKLSEELIIYMYEEWFEKMARKLGIDRVLDGKNSVDIMLPSDVSSKINGEELFHESYKISRKK